MKLNDILGNPFFWITFAGIIISMLSRVFITTQFKRLVGLKSRRAWTANRAASDMLKQYDMGDMEIVETGGEFSSVYDKKNNTIMMGGANYRSTNVLAIVDALACVARAVQYKRGNVFITLRNLIMTPLRILAMIGVPAVVVAVIFRLPWLYQAVLIVYALLTVISVISIPIEVSTSGMVKKTVKERGYLSDDEYPAMNSILMSMNLAYPSTIFQSITQLFKMIGSILGIGRFKKAYGEASEEQKQKRKKKKA